jgi:3-hydroxyisobutyrate dehydrogenase-like beta-hydroxyacid dehydrogenase
MSGSSRGAVGVIGLGAMGSRMARHLSDDGRELAVYDVRREAMLPLMERGAKACSSPRAVADVAATVLVSLPTPDVVRAVACGEDGLVHGRGIRTFVDLSTTGVSVAEEVATTLAKAGIAHLDAPVSGGVAGADARTLTIMASGPQDVFTAVLPLLEVLGQKVFWVGPAPGQGQLAKLLNNLLSATALAITSEAMAFGVSAGLDARTLLEIFNASSGRNTATSDKFPQQVLTRKFGAGFRLKLMAKDVELCLAEARSRHIPLVVGSVVQQLWTLAARQAAVEDDMTVIVRTFEDWTGVTVKDREAVDAGV